MATVEEIRKKKKEEFTPLPKKQTPEEEAQAQSEGQSFIQEREQRISALSAQGATMPSATKQAGKELTAKAESTPEFLAGQQLEIQDIQDRILMQRNLDLLKTLPEAQRFFAPELQTLAPSPQEEIDIEKHKPLKQLVQEKGIKEAARIQLPTISEGIDILRKGITGGKALKVTTAEENLANSMQLLKDDVELVRSGLKDPTAAKKDFIAVQTALNQLEGSQKGLGKVNLRYWSSGGGREVETEIRVNQILLQDLNTKLELASQEANLNRARSLVR